MKNLIISLFIASSFLGTAANVFADDESSKNILKQGLLGAGVGAISASASGGKAGKGALIGAGTNVIGGALLDTLMPSQPKQQPVQYVQAQPQYVQQQPQYAQQQPQYVQQDQAYQQNTAQNQAPVNSQPKKHIYRKYDKDGNVISEEEVWE